MKLVVVNALSVDVEEYYHALVFQDGTRGLTRGGFESRVEDSVERVLGLLDTREVRATFFVLGEVAIAHPALVRKIAGNGHEIACHGHRHELVSGQSPAEFRADVRQAKDVLEDLTGEPVLGYRAPNFSIGRAQRWAYDVLLEEGFRYDSSTYPILHDRYGDPGAPRFPHEVRRTGDRTLMEFPIGTARVGGVNWPVGGGGYFRLLPVTWIRRGIQRVNRLEGRPTMFYFHPWELDPDQPRPAMRWPHRVRHYVGMRRQATKLAHLLESIRFTAARDLLGI
ncbi:MAG: XrtA system polysaccharide deacetylase [Candidatus Rokuibacteriota bacterium]